MPVPGGTATFALMSESESESTAGIDDKQLPEDLQPGEANPLAEPLDDEVDPDELDVLEGKGAEESAGDSDDGASDQDA